MKTILLALMSICLASPICAWSFALVEQAPQDEAAENKEVVLSSIEVTSKQRIGSLKELRHALEKYRELPETTRTNISLGFYLTGKKTGEIIDPISASRLDISIENKDGESKSVELLDSGRLMIGDDDINGMQAYQILANIRRSTIEVTPKPTINVPQGNPMSLGYLRHASINFLEAHKLFAGMLFRQFIGSKKPNCIGFSFDQPQSVTLRSKGGIVWQGGPSKRVVMYFSDVFNYPDDSLIEWTGNDQPERIIGCLMSKK